jgi:glycosyltransferase involved in cell wall biosynthesis
MRILVLTELFPYPPTNGGMLRTHHLLRGVAEHHHLDIACFAGDQPKVPYANATVHRVPHPSFTKSARAIALLNPTPVYPLGKMSKAMSQLIREICKTRHPDVCHIDTMGMAGYARELDIPVVIDLMDCVSLHYERLAKIQTSPLRRALYTFERSKITRFERKISRIASAMICCVQQDADAMKAITGTDVRVIGNGVDAPSVLHATPSTHPVIVFLGFLEYPPNRDAIQFFGDEAWPQILERFPHARFEIFGKGPPVALRKMKNVEFKGYVADLSSAYNTASIFVAPIRAGGGIKNKVLEAMAYGVPVIATSLAVDGIGGTDGEHYVIANDAQSFFKQTEKLLTTPGLSQQVGMTGRRFVQEHFDWGRASSELAALYENVLRQ